MVKEEGFFISCVQQKQIFCLTIRTHTAWLALSTPCYDTRYQRAGNTAHGSWANTQSLM